MPSAAGFSLVELVVFISIISLAMAGVMAALSFTNRYSPDPMVRKQALAIAEGLMQEIQQMPFTYCDPNDANAATATAFSQCTTDSQQLLTGPSPVSESRYNQVNPFDNVADYGNFVMPGNGCSGICRVGDSTPIAGLGAYSASVSLSNVGGTAAFPGLTSDAAIQITVSVTGPASTQIVLTGYRVRYVPRV